MQPKVLNKDKRKSSTGNCYPQNYRKRVTKLISVDRSAYYELGKEISSQATIRIHNVLPNGSSSFKKIIITSIKQKTKHLMVILLQMEI
jgi:hypothetical protein